MCPRKSAGGEGTGDEFYSPRSGDGQRGRQKFRSPSTTATAVAAKRSGAVRKRWSGKRDINKNQKETETARERTRKPEKEQTGRGPQHLFDVGSEQ